MSIDEIKPGDHITVAGVVTEVGFIGLITIKTKSGWEFTFDPNDTQTYERGSKRMRWLWFIGGLAYIACMQIIRPDSDYTLGMVMLYAAMLISDRGKG